MRITKNIMRSTEGSLVANNWLEIDRIHKFMNKDKTTMGSIRVQIVADMETIKARVEANNRATEAMNSLYIEQGGSWAKLSESEAMELHVCTKDIIVHYLDSNIQFTEVDDTDDLVQRIKENRIFAFNVGKVDETNVDMFFFLGFAFRRISQRDAEAMINNNIREVYVLEEDKAILYSGAKSHLLEDNEFLICVANLSDIETRKDSDDLLINSEKFAWLTITPSMARRLVEYTDIDVYTLDQPYEHPVDEIELEKCIESRSIPLAIPLGYVYDTEETIRITDDFFVWRTFTPEEASLIWKHGIFTLYVLYDDGSEALIEDAESFLEAMTNGAVFGTEAGFLYEAGSI